MDQLSRPVFELAISWVRSAFKSKYERSAHEYSVCSYCTVTLMFVVWEMAPARAVNMIDAVPRFVCPLVAYPPQETSVSARVTTVSALAVTLRNAA